MNPDETRLFICIIIFWKSNLDFSGHDFPVFVNGWGNPTKFDKRQL